MASKRTNLEQEPELLAFLEKIQNILSTALNSLGGKKPTSAEAAYLCWACVSVNQAADGYLVLRKANRLGASKLLIRPALEVTFAAASIIKDKSLLFRKAYTEWEEDKKFLSHDSAGKEFSAKALAQLKAHYQEHLPSYPAECKPLKVQEMARIAGLLPVYEKVYRVYCKFTHGAQRAIQGQLDNSTNKHDTTMVILCVLMMLKLLKAHTQAELPDLEPYETNDFVK